MEVVPVVDRGLGNSSYVVDSGDGQCLVVDPERDPAPYLAEAERRGLRLRWVAENHLHADFVSGGAGARRRGRIPAGAGRQRAGLRPPTAGGRSGARPRRADPTGDPHAGAHPRAPGVCAGGRRLAAGPVLRRDAHGRRGGAHRPALARLTEPLALAAYRSIRDALLTLHDDLAVYPTHGAGSFCSVGAGGERTTTIGRERAANPLLQVSSEDEFVRLLFGGLGTYPPYFLPLRAVNQAGPRVDGPDAAGPAPLDPVAVERLVAAGAEVVDVRPIGRFAAAHLPGLLSIELRDQFATWLGWLVEPGRLLILVAGGDQDLGRVCWEARKVGLDDVAGYLQGGIEAWVASGRQTAAIPLLAPEAIPPTATILDVRQQTEWDAGHVPGALHVELGAVASVRHDDGVVVHCGHGQRAMTGASLLRRSGVREVAVTTADARTLAVALAAAS